MITSDTQMFAAVVVLAVLLGTAAASLIGAGWVARGRDAAERVAAAQDRADRAARVLAVALRSVREYATEETARRVQADVDAAFDGGTTTTGRHAAIGGEQ